jgi:hypothetical protein
MVEILPQEYKNHKQSMNFLVTIQHLLCVTSMLAKYCQDGVKAQTD